MYWLKPDSIVRVYCTQVPEHALMVSRMKDEKKTPTLGGWRLRMTQIRGFANGSSARNYTSLLHQFGHVFGQVP